MKKIIFLINITFSSIALYAQDTTSTPVDEAPPIDVSNFTDAVETKNYCTQKVIGQTPTKLISVGWEQQLGFKNTISNAGGTTFAEDKINGMGGLRTSINILAISNNKMLLSIGTNYWASKVNASNAPLEPTMRQIYNNTQHIEQVNALLFKPLNAKNFIVAQVNADNAFIGTNNNYKLTKPSITLYGSIIYGWKTSDYLMWGIGVSRTYRLGRVIHVPALLYNKTFNERWGIEALLPARAALRYNFSTNSMLLAGFELEGQQFDIEASSNFLQRGEIKPRITWEQKLKGFIWLSAQAGYRLNGRNVVVDRYTGKGEHEVITNTWGPAPYFNISLNFVSP